MEQLKQCLEMLNEIYDVVRIIHPLKKQILNHHEALPPNIDFHCFDLWAKGKMCNNCISMRAYQQKETQFKLEYKQGKIYMVMAVPVKDANNLVILELLKDITNSMLVENFTSDSDHTILKLLNETAQLQIKDALTGLLNRRFIDERLPVDIHNRNMDSSPLSIILADIDHFKKVNDTYGHVAGDHILREFALLFQQIISKDGWVARYGGEEFLISLPDTGKDAAEAIAEKLRSAAENNEFIYDGSIIRITSSFGICTLVHGKNLTVEEAVEYADKNLYQAKNSGRNRVVASEIE